MPIIIFIIIELIVALTVCAVIDIRNKNIVLEKSQRVKTLLYLNKTIEFRTIQPNYYTQMSCNSKHQLDYLSMDDYLMSLIDSDENFYRHIVETISLNRSKYDKYMTQVQKSELTATEDYCQSFGFTLTEFQKYEERIIREKLLPKPQWEVTVHCKATYSSPQGRNHYWKEQSYSYDELEKFFNDTMSLKAQRQTRQYLIRMERAKMTESLRYDIFKRDNYRCQICGLSQRDGVVLHVDHIIPVSKGGKTEPSNLQTLCDRCNLGKSNKM